MSGVEVSGLFEDIKTFTDDGAQRRYDALVGLDAIKDRLTKEAAILIEPDLLKKWSLHHHKQVITAVAAFRERIPLFVFAGDVGTGKTQLAETFGDAVARELGLEVLLLPISLRARGGGSVGEMTQLISSAFDYVQAEIPIPKGESPQTAAVLLVDEADALAQSRELDHMHHEDRAGVNALIRGIDGVATDGRPVITVMCTNRLSALDPAIRRRAHIFEFRRPDLEQRAAVLRRDLAGVGLDAEQVAQLAELTGARDGSPGCTYSDLTTRFIPDAILDAYPYNPLSFDRLRELAEQIVATPAFDAEGAAS